MSDEQPGADFVVGERTFHVGHAIMLEILAQRKREHPRKVALCLRCETACIGGDDSPRMCDCCTTAPGDALFNQGSSRKFSRWNRCDTGDHREIPGEALDAAIAEMLSAA